MCECCKSKQARNSFKSEIQIRSKEKLEVIFSYVCCLFEVKTLGGNNYFVSFINKFIRKMWIYLIKKKSEVFEIFKNLKLVVENKVGKRSTCLKQMKGVNITLMNFRNYVMKKV